MLNNSQTIRFHKGIQSIQERACRSISFKSLKLHEHLTDGMKYIPTVVCKQILNNQVLKRIGKKNSGNCVFSESLFGYIRMK